MSSPIDTSASAPPPGVPITPPVAKPKSESTAIVPTLLWPGAGQWYAGERHRAVA